MTSLTCKNCGVGYGPDDMFCENCGYDFITGSLPVDAGPPSAAPVVPPAGSDGGTSAGSPASPFGVAPSVLSGDAPSADEEFQSGPSSAGPAGPAQSSATGSSSTASGVGGLDVPRLKLSVAVDKDFFEAVVTDGEIDLPDPVPLDQELELAGDEIHIGRTSESRAIHPDVDVAKLTGDQAVSSRHAVLRVANDGTYTVVDVGSTNGTFLTEVDSDPLDHGIPKAVQVGTPIYVGAWTKLTILA